MERRAKFFVIEGLDGAGVTTQTERLKNWIDKKGYEVSLTKEPSDGPLGALIRLHLARRLFFEEAKGNFVPLDDYCLALLFAADRMDHLHNVILPRLNSGVIVISDRYYLSSLAYQSLKVDLRWIKQINSNCVRPDLTLFIDVPAQICKKRIDRQRWHVEIYEDIEILEEVRRSYLSVIRELVIEGEKIEVINGNQPVQKVQSEVTNAIKKILSKTAVGSLKQLSYFSDSKISEVR